MQSHRMTPEQLTRLRVRHRTEYEFAVEQNCIEAGAAISEAELHAELDTLSRTEERVLETRIKRRIRHVDDLMNRSRQTFEEPHATPSDLPAAVTLTNQME